MSATLQCPNCTSTLREEGDESKQTRHSKPREYRVIDAQVQGTLQRMVRCLVCNYEAEPMDFE